MITTNNESWAEEIRLKSLHGISGHAWKRYRSEGFQSYDTLYAGYKYNMTDLQASLGIHQLARLENNLKVREQYWQRYNQAFAELNCVVCPREPEPGDKHARHLYTLLLDVEQLGLDRDAFAARLKALNIGTGIHFIALHLHSFYRETFGYRRGDFPESEYISDRTISLPLSARLSERDVDDVIAAVYEVING